METKKKASHPSFTVVAKLTEFIMKSCLYCFFILGKSKEDIKNLKKARREIEVLSSKIKRFSVSDINPSKKQFK